MKSEHQPGDCRRKFSTSLLAFVLTSLLFAGCDPSSEVPASLSPDPDDYVPVSQYRQAVREKNELEAINAVAERRAEYAENTIAKERAEKEQIERGRSLWRSSSAFLIVVAGLTLFLGAAAGSVARKEAQHHESS